jgi:hypothetical protein
MLLKIPVKLPHEKLMLRDPRSTRVQPDLLFDRLIGSMPKFVDVRGPEVNKVGVELKRHYVNPRVNRRLTEASAQSYQF